MPIEILHIASPDALHRLRHALLGPWRGEQVDMVRHKHVCMDSELVAFSGIQQAFLEELQVLIITEDRITIVAPQNDMERDTFDKVAWETGHIVNLAHKSSLTPYIPFYAMTNSRCIAQCADDAHQAQGALIPSFDCRSQTGAALGVNGWAFVGKKILYDSLCMHGLPFAVWSLRMRGLTQPCMHRFERVNNAYFECLQEKFEEKAQSLTLHIPTYSDELESGDAKIQELTSGLQPTIISILSRRLRMATWAEDISDALIRLGGIAPLSAIYAEVKKVRATPHPQAIEATIRGAIERNSSDSLAFSSGQDLFFSVHGLGAGTWGLRSFLKSTPQANDIEPLPLGTESPGRAQQTTYRILRDTDLAQKIKLLHQNKCQVCATVIELANRAYAEAHHIQPIGSPHFGPDIPGNIIVVCPNCHVRLDYFSVRLDLKMIRTIKGHSVEIKYIDYHNQHVDRILESEYSGTD
jgi:hypothetical protein